MSAILFEKNQLLSMKNLLEINNIVKNYGDFRALNDVSIHIPKGCVYGLLGPNGAGKTTSFYMIVGLIKPNDGRVFLNDKEITKEPMYKRAQLGIGYLAQEASVFRSMSVEDNKTFSMAGHFESIFVKKSNSKKTNNSSCFDLYQLKNI